MKNHRLWPLPAALVGAALLTLSLSAEAQRDDTPEARKKTLDALIEPNKQPNTTGGGPIKGGTITEKDKAALDEAAKRAGKSGLTQSDTKNLDEAQRLSGSGGVVPQLNAPTSTINIDPSKVAEQYAQILKNPEKGDGSESPKEVMIFVSLSMPKTSLERIAAEAGRLGLPLYFRGVTKGLGVNYNASIGAMNFVRQAGADLQIHPELFKQYDIRRVPAFVVAQNPQAGCSVDQCDSAAAVVYGDVGIQFAMSVIGKRNDGVGDIARKTVARIEGLPVQGRDQGNVRKKVRQ